MSLVECVAVIVRRGDEILLGRRSKRYGFGQWQIPGGKCDGMKPRRAALKELWEETGLRGREEDLVFVTDVFRKDDEDGTSYRTLIFELREFKGNPVNKEPDKNAGWQWFNVGKLPNNLFEIGGLMEDYLANF